MEISEIPAKLARVPISKLKTISLIFVGISTLMGLLVGDVSRILGYSLLGIYLWKSTRFHDLVLYVSVISTLYGLLSFFADANYLWGVFQVIGSLALALYASRHKMGNV